MAAWPTGPHPRAYLRDVRSFLAFVGKPLRVITLGDAQAFADSLSALSSASRARTLAALKSLYTFGHGTGYLVYNIGTALRLPSQKHTLAERILTESAVQRMLVLETDGRNHALLRVLYSAGLRVAEVCALRWRDAQERDDAGQLVVFGKGGKTRVVLLSADTWRELDSLRGGYPQGAGPDDPIFQTKRGTALSPVQVWRIVKQAAKRAGLPDGVSPHWLRHAHASHALDRGATVSLVKETLGHASVATTGRYLHARPEDSSARYLPV